MSQVDDELLLACVDDPQRRSQVPASTLTAAFLERIERYQPVINAFINTTGERALRQAGAVDRARGRGRPLPLDGMCVAVKDNIDLGGERTTAGAAFLNANVALGDAEVVRRLDEAGAVIVGKTNMHEVAFGGTTDNEFYGTCRNPWDLERIPGGSSGGSGAAVAADLCIAALGTDTGGSVRLPAAINGVAGLRPSFGRVSKRGVYPLSWSIDTVGPLARSVRDLAAMLVVMGGYDPNDPWAIDYPRALAPTAEQGVEGLRIGLPDAHFFESLPVEAEGLVRGAAQILADLGARVGDIHIEGAAAAYEAGMLIVGVDAVAVNQEAMSRQAFSEGTRRRLGLYEARSGVDYARATEQAVTWRRLVQRLLVEQVDILLTPTTGPPARIDESDTVTTTQAMSACTYPWSVAHLTALSLPCGFDADGLPVGFQMAAAPGRESVLLRAGLAYQAITAWHTRRPAAVWQGAPHRVNRPGFDPAAASAPNQHC
jgi:aspartyl-tRNA(Asn)/glutamyl-tRNA(Gln) amidotransferase subunit A